MTATAGSVVLQIIPATPSPMFNDKPRGLIVARKW